VSATRIDPVQIVGYEPVPDPALLVATDGVVDRVPLEPGRTLRYRLGERHCAGVVQGDGHEPCTAPEAPRCDRHTETVNPNRMVAARDGEHAVYLAAFAPATFKVGVTRAERLETRLREQGADRGAHVFSATDGAIAREIEVDVAGGSYGTPVRESVRVPTKLRGFGRSVDEDAWASLLADFEVRERFDFGYGLELTGQPVPETIASGTIRGVKGRVLVVETAGTIYAVDLRDLIGHDATEGEPGVDRQSSLGAFE
jgi:hypothetical protein